MDAYYWVIFVALALGVIRKLYILCNPNETPEKPDQGTTGIAFCVLIALCVWTLTHGGLI